ncbi:pyruvate formate lyase family protein [Alloacidobacterium dinghuense]|uniref:pyruvate formate lyase family protein n=1 Tax=Alloacidobacterium dinghuense TaxID=2763107 RepID=UPI001C96E2A6
MPSRTEPDGSSYGLDISEPARSAREAVQWLYFVYLAAVKEQKRCSHFPWQHINLP